MMHLVGVSSNSASARHMTGLSNVKEKAQNGNSNVFKFNQKENEKEEDNAVTKLQSQINSLRERVQDIAKNDALDEKTKSELTQNIKEQMNTLSQQLRQRQLEVRQEELEKEEEEQQANKAPDSEEVSKNTGRAKYDTFTNDDVMSRVGTAMVSASNSVELSKLQQGISTRKENQISLLEKQAQNDTRDVRKTEFYHTTKLIGGKTPAEETESETETEGVAETTVVYTSSKTEANISEVNTNSVSASQRIAEAIREAEEENEDENLKEIDDVIPKQVWEVSTGEAVEAKKEEAAKLKADISGIDEDQAENLGDANRIINGTAEETEKAEEPLIKVDAELIAGIKIQYTNPLRAYSNAQNAAENDRGNAPNALDAYA